MAAIEGADSTIELLGSTLSERKSRNRSYSLRAFARDLGISPAYLSLLMRGKKPLTRSLAAQLSVELQIPVSRIRQIVGKPEASAVVSIEAEKFRALKHWYHLAILDLTTCVHFEPDVAWISRQLGISKIEARDAVRRLLNLGLLENKGGRWRKTHADLRVPTRKSVSAVREFHRQMISKASDELLKTSASDFRRREIRATTIAVNPAHLAEAREKIVKFQRTLAKFLTRGACTELYQLNTQLFPLTPSGKAEEN